ncbi:Response regulator aspartate phosphatase J [compost metagenome]
MKSYRAGLRGLLALSVVVGTLGTPAPVEARADVATTQKLLALMKAGNAAGAREDYPTAIAQLTEAKNLALQHDENRVALAVMYLLAMLQMKSGDVEGGLATFEETVPVAQRPGVEETGMMILGKAGNAFFKFERSAQAARAYGAAAQIARRLGKTDELVYNLRFFAKTAYDAGAYQSALAAFDELLAIFRQRGDEAEVAAQLSGQGMVYRALNRYEEARTTFLAALALSRKLGKEDRVMLNLNNVAWAHDQLGDYQAGAKAYEEALAIARRIATPDEVATVLGNLAAAREGLSQFDLALEAYREALAIARQVAAVPVKVDGHDPIGLKALEAAAEAVKREAQVAILLNNVGNAYNSLGRYPEALAVFEESLSLYRKHKLKQADGVLANIGSVYGNQGRFDRAIAAYEETIAMARAAKDDEALPTRLNNLASIYQAWGQTPKGIPYIQEAIALSRKLGREAQTAALLNNLGTAYSNTGRAEEALALYDEALRIVEKLGLEGETASYLGNLAGLLLRNGDTERAIKIYEQVLEVDRRLGRPADTARRLEAIGTAYHLQDRGALARKHYQEALAIHRKLGQRSQAAGVLASLGFSYYGDSKFEEALPFLREAIEGFDTVRQTASGEARRDYLASQVEAYQLLVSSLIATNRADEALQAGERARGRMLAEALSNNPAAQAAPSVEALKKGLAPGEAILVLTPSPTGETLALVVTAAGVTAKRTMLTATTPAMVLSQAEARRHRGVSVVEDDAPVETLAKQGLDSLVAGYRSHLAGADSAGTPQARAMGRALYDHLVAPFEGHLKGVTRLTVVPDGALGLLPFEALVGADGKYLVERFEVAYAHSLTVRQALRDRKAPAAGKPILAVGGAVYAPESYKTDMTPAVAGLKQPAIKAAYASWGPVAGQTAMIANLKTRGLGAFGNLPGTLSEVDAIAGGFSGADVLVGPQASKAELLKRDLAAYRVLHFATHGVADPQRPEGSGLLLSVGPKEDDALLSAPEVAKLKLSAEFVCLSACQTGVGKVVGGEGVVGLSQAFLQAGAGGLAMSLWSVDDAGTAAFMSGLYQGGKSPDAAKMASLKRKMLQDPRFKSPYFWAPFVYYGR